MPTSPSPHVSFYNTKTAAWIKADRDGDSDSNFPELTAFEELQKFLIEILHCEQLVVLSGLGTSF